MWELITFMSESLPSCVVFQLLHSAFLLFLIIPFFLSPFPFFMAQNFNFLFFSPFALIFFGTFPCCLMLPFFFPPFIIRNMVAFFFYFFFFYHSFNTKFLIFQSIMVFPFDCESIIQSWLLWYDTHTLFPFFLYSKVLQPKLGWV